MPDRNGSLCDYRPESGVYDEMMLPSGELRQHWQIFGSFLNHCTAGDFTLRAESIQRLLRDHGVTYNVYDDALGTSRPWALDALPFIVAQQEFRHVQRGLDQRGRLLDAALRDLYGPQKLLRDGVLPPGLIYANPGYLRSVLGIDPPGGRFIFTMGSDLVRGTDGQWHVLADRTQAPSGHGYALENRIILANVYAEEFNASKVKRLAAYFEMKRDMLRSLTPKRRQGESGILMLTPGPYSETYYEHAFQARYLGFPLVEGADLTVRDRHVHLKTLEGLRQVDVMVRHVDDISCDPLELRSDSLLGTAGLLEAWRSGSLALANGLGTGLVETPALHPFMPDLCRHLLGEELILPCVQTLWCGQNQAIDTLLAQPDRWVVKPAFARGARNPVFLADLDAKQKSRMIETIRAAPHDWIAQEVLSLSTAPTWTGSKIEPRSLVWRAFAISQGGGFTAMPGGLSRVSPEPHRWLVTMRSGGISKDTWVIGDGSIDAYYESRRQQQPVIIRPSRPPSGVPSRVADHLYWLGRYAERLEATVRILRAIMQRLAGERTQVQERELEGCLVLMNRMGLVPKKGTISMIDNLQSLLLDAKNDCSVPHLLSRLHYNAAAARDRLSDDTWRLFNRIDRDARLPVGPFVVSTALGVLDTLILDLAAFSGMQQENMTRGHGWRFLEIGKRVERAGIVLELVSTATQQCASDDQLLNPLLEICDSTMTYRRLHFAHPSLIPVLDLLLLNDINPRSIAHQLNILGRQTSQLPPDPAADRGESAHHQCDSLQSDLAALNLAALAKAGDEIFSHMPVVCGKLSDGLDKLSNLITAHFFSHASHRSEN